MFSKLCVLGRIDHGSAQSSTSRSVEVSDSPNPASPLVRDYHSQSPSSSREDALESSHFTGFLEPHASSQTDEHAGITQTQGLFPGAPSSPKFSPRKIRSKRTGSPAKCKNCNLKRMKIVIFF